MLIIDNIRAKKNNKITERLMTLYTESEAKGNWESVQEEELNRILKQYEKYYQSGKAPYSDEYSFESFNKAIRDYGQLYNGERLAMFEIEKDFYAEDTYLTDSWTVIENLPRKHDNIRVYTDRKDKLGYEVEDKVRANKRYTLATFVKEVDEQIDKELKKLGKIKSNVEKEIDKYLERADVKEFMPTEQLSLTKEKIRRGMKDTLEKTYNLNEELIIKHGIKPLDDSEIKDAVTRSYIGYIVSQYIENAGWGYSRKDFDYGNKQGFIAYATDNLKELPKEVGVMWGVYLEEELRKLKEEYQEYERFRKRY